MRLRKSKARSPVNGAVSFVDKAAEPELLSCSDFRHSHSYPASHHKDPAWVLAEAALRLQLTLDELDTLMFEVAGVGPASRARIHDAVALVMETLQALDQARAVLPRSNALDAPLVAHLLSGPLARA